MKKFTSGFLLVVLSLLFFVSCDLSLKGDEKKLHPDIYVLKDTAEVVSGSGLFSFGEVTADGNNGLTSAETVFTVENRGKGNLNISSIAISSGDIQDFDLVRTIENKIAPNKSDTFSIKFDPLTPGDKSAVVTITSNDPDKGTFTFNIKGRAVPKIIYNPDINIVQGTTNISSGSSAHNFEETVVDGDNGTVSSEVIFTIENLGNSDLDITEISLTSGDATDFDIINSTTGVIAPSASTTFSVRFDPLSEGEKNAVISLASNDPDEGTYTLNISGAGKNISDINILKGTDTVASGSAAHSFEEILVDGDDATVSSEVIFTIENLGNADLDITSISLTSGDVTDFDIVKSPTEAITPSASATFSVRFDPLSEGDKSATLTVASNDPDESSYTLVLTGKGNYIVETIILIDASGSVKQEGWDKEIAFVNSLITSNLPADDRLGVIEYNSRVISRWDLNDTQDRSQISAKIKILSFKGGATHHKSALDGASRMFNTSSVTPSKRNIIMITDGPSNPKSENPNSYEAESTRILLNSLNVELFIVGIGDDMTFHQLNVIYELQSEYNPVSGEYLNVPTFDDLAAAAPKVAEMVNKKN